MARGFQIVAKLKKLHGVNIKHLLVTREHSAVGWKLYDLAYDVELPDGTHVSLGSDVRIFQRGLPFADLFMLYCAADAYLSCSRGEGLGLPIIEAMSVGVPVVANAVGALPELLAEDRGWLVKADSWNYDPFGNQKRYDISIDHAVESLRQVADRPSQVVARTLLSRQFMESKTWDKPVQQIEDALKKMFENGT